MSESVVPIRISTWSNLFQPKLIKLFLGSFLWFAVLGCVACIKMGTEAEVIFVDPHGKEGFLPELPAGKEWKLIWSDEFNGGSLDEDFWETPVGKRRDGYWVKEDSYLDGEGHLVLRTKKDGERYTSGAIRTRGKFEHLSLIHI